MAKKNSRTCEKCGGKASPHIPRQRVDGRLLCSGCAQTESHKMTTASKGPGPNKGDGKAIKKAPAQSGATFDFWDGELAPEGHHPLASPLPNSIWEKYAKHRALLGKDPMRPEHYNEAEKRGAASGDADPFPGSRLDQANKKQGVRKEADSSQGMKPGPELVKHLHEAHNLPQAIASIHGAGIAKHEDLHKNDLKSDHSHGPNGEIIPKTKELPHPEGNEGLKQHLTQHHNIANWEVDLMGDDHDALQDQHDQFHENTAYSGSDKPNHTHDEGVATATKAPHPPAKTMGGKTMVQHFKDEHGLSQNDVYTAFKSGGDHPTDGGIGAAQKWHDEAHAAGLPHSHGHEHKEFGEDGPEQLKHPSKFTSSSLHGHLLEDHGIDPDHMENAIDGTYEATDASHIVHMLHNAAHANGQVKNAHTHENWEGGEKVSPVHKDVGKPFWGAPPNSASKHYSHLTDSPQTGGHGIPYQNLPSVSDLSDEDASKAYTQFHDTHHADHGDDLLHQHFPTIQPGVLSPKKQQKQKLQQHLEEFHGVKGSTHPEMDHGVLHDAEAYGYKGHPGHEHTPGDQHGPVTQSLPSEYGGTEHSSMPKHVPNLKHPADMGANDLGDHIALHHDEDPFGAFVANEGKTHDQLVQEHALHHAKGDGSAHTHDSMANTDPLQNPQYGHEPEVQTTTHPAIDSESDAMGHILKHHPEVNQEQYKAWQTKYKGPQATMKSFHETLHAKDSQGLPKPADGHDHAEPSGAPTTIAVGSHLVHDHGMDQADVASMTPAEFKAHHEKLHLKESDLDVGHGHDYPGGPVRDPRTHLTNTHHQKMRDDDRHPSVNEWYHGTGTDYEGAPKNATELQEGHGFWGNWGGGDWNNHVGTHWTSLHQMAANFSGKMNNGQNRVIHAKLHISNPVTYNSLNHMAHDAYDRMRASGHLQDDGEWEGNHDDASGYNRCCSDTLLEYAKGHHRSDGKYGVEAFRDSLRASGYDGIHVRNQADSPEGHWNAIPLSADQVEVTHGGCRGTHGDARDNDTSEFNSNADKTTAGWQHPKAFKNSDYHGTRLDHLPEEDEVAEANASKGQKKPRFKTAEGRGDADPYLNGRHFAQGSDDDEDEGHEWCDHCEGDTDHSTEDCQVSKYCSVCEEHGDHEVGDDNSPHEYCSHCDDYADHDTEDHTDEYGEKPDEFRKEAYCPHCNESSKENYNSTTCTNCGEDLPDWGKLAAHGKAVKPGDYHRDGDTDSTAYGHASGAKLHPNTKDGAEVAAHLYHHHKSDVGGKEFDNEGEWDTDSLNYHHQYLHQNAAEAKGNGFQVDHDHKHLFGQFPKKMTPEATHAHLMLAHGGSEAGQLSLNDIGNLTPDEAVKKHAELHEADDAVKWGEKNEHSGEIKPKLNHTHTLEGSQGSFDEEFHPKGEHLLAHLGDKKSHLPFIPVSISDTLKNSPKTANALHQQMHENYGPAAEPGVGKFHVHTPEMLQDLKNHAAIKSHLVNDHGADEDHYQVKNSNTEDLMTLHHQEHTSAFPNFNDPDHVHFGGTAHKDPEGHTAKTMKKPEPEGEKKEHISVASPTVNKWGEGSLIDHADVHHPSLKEHSDKVMDTAMETGQNSPQVGQAIQALHEAHEKIHAPGGPGHPDHYHYDHENKTKTPPEGKTASLRTLTSLFEEVAL